MQFTATELSLINVVLINVGVEEGDKETAKTIWELLKGSVQEGAKFEDAELELNAIHRTFLIKVIPRLSWTIPQWELVDAFLKKLNA